MHPLPQVATVEEVLPKEDTINVEGEVAKEVEVTSVNEVETEADADTKAAEADTKVVEAEAVAISPILTVAGMTRVVEAVEVTVVDAEEVVAAEVPMVGEGMEDMVLLVAMIRVSPHNVCVYSRSWSGLPYFF